MSEALFFLWNFQLAKMLIIILAKYLDSIASRKLILAKINFFPEKNFAKITSCEN